MTLLIILMMACNLWMLFYLTREHERGQRDDGQDSTAMTRQEPSEDIIGKSKFRMPERTRTEKATCVPEAAIPVKAEAVDEKDVTFADELKDTGNHATEKDVSRQVPDEDLDKVFEDNRTYAPDEDFDEEPHRQAEFLRRDRPGCKDGEGCQGEGAGNPASGQGVP